MAGTHVGQIILAVNGLPNVNIKSFDYRVLTNKEEVMGMSPTGESIGHTGGTKTYELNVEAYVPRTGDIAWADIDGGVLFAVPRDGGAIAPLFVGVFCKEVGVSFNEKGAAIRKITLGAASQVGVI